MDGRAVLRMLQPGALQALTGVKSLEDIAPGAAAELKLSGTS